ncbi:AAA family ATPase, partial [Rugamonas sp. FT107W]
RLLPVDQFASYSVLVALVETLTAVSGLGLAHALLRYVPELDVVVDAAHLHRWQRQPFQALARELGLAFVIVDLPADDALLRERLRQRALGPPDASDAGTEVLDYQYATHEPLTAAEHRHALTLDGAAVDLPARIGTLAAMVRARRRPAPGTPPPAAAG